MGYTFFYVLLAAAAAATLFFFICVFLAAPKRPSETQARVLAHGLFAHRGLFDNQNGYPENSLEAINHAADRGYGIELDVQLTRDGQVVVFHDDDLLRACGDSRKVFEMDYSELKTLRIFKEPYRVPLFTDVLHAVGGRTPIIVEIKSRGFCNHDDNEETCKKTYEILKQYDGDTVVESFDPRIVSWFKINAPEVTRGQLATGKGGYGKVNRAAAWAMQNLLTNILGRPHFVAYNIEYQGFAFRLSRVLGARPVSWTSRDKADCERRAAEGEAVIFEAIEPELPRETGGGR